MTTAMTISDHLANTSTPVVTTSDEPSMVATSDHPANTSTIVATTSSPPSMVTTSALPATVTTSRHPADTTSLIPTTSVPNTRTTIDELARGTTSRLDDLAHSQIICNNRINELQSVEIDASKSQQVDITPRLQRVLFSDLPTPVTGSGQQQSIQANDLRAPITNSRQQHQNHVNESSALIIDSRQQRPRKQARSSQGSEDTQTYCSYHKSKTHNTEECRHLQEWLLNKYRNDRDSSSKDQQNDKAPKNEVNVFDKSRKNAIANTDRNQPRRALTITRTKLRAGRNLTLMPHIRRHSTSTLSHTTMTCFLTTTIFLLPSCLSSIFNPRSQSHMNRRKWTSKIKGRDISQFLGFKLNTNNQVCLLLPPDQFILKMPNLTIRNNYCLFLPSLGSIKHSHNLIHSIHRCANNLLIFHIPPHLFHTRIKSSKHIIMSRYCPAIPPARHLFLLLKTLQVGRLTLLHPEKQLSYNSQVTSELLIPLTAPAVVKRQTINATRRLKQLKKITTSRGQTIERMFKRQPSPQQATQPPKTAQHQSSQLCEILKGARFLANDQRQLSSSQPSRLPQQQLPFQKHQRTGQELSIPRTHYHQEQEEHQLNDDLQNKTTINKNVKQEHTNKSETTIAHVNTNIRGCEQSCNYVSDSSRSKLSECNKMFITIRQQQPREGKPQMILGEPEVINTKPPIGNRPRTFIFARDTRFYDSITATTTTNTALLITKIIMLITKITTSIYTISVTHVIIANSGTITVTSKLVLLTFLININVTGPILLITGASQNTIIFNINVFNVIISSIISNNYELPSEELVVSDDDSLARKEFANCICSYSRIVSNIVFCTKDDELKTTGGVFKDGLDPPTPGSATKFVPCSSKRNSVPSSIKLALTLPSASLPVRVPTSAKITDSAISDHDLRPSASSILRTIKDSCSRANSPSNELNPTSSQHGSVELGIASDKLVPSTSRPHSFTDKESDTTDEIKLGTAIDVLTTPEADRRATNDKLTTPGADLGATIDELGISGNVREISTGKLGATVDELGISTGELGATVDELGTFTGELGAKVDELATPRADLEDTVDKLSPVTTSATIDEPSPNKQTGGETSLYKRQADHKTKLSSPFTTKSLGLFSHRPQAQLTPHDQIELDRKLGSPFTTKSLGLFSHRPQARLTLHDQIELGLFSHRPQAQLLLQIELGLFSSSVSSPTSQTASSTLSTVKKKEGGEEPRAQHCQP
ncbi:LOW QUALITY PROTEIN: hypothetical protein HID58_080870 [Brassica napus]|uniref:Uncharacterized protein n=1 Tax=Brassica napus TaxID=3708 RepID=A0ABQ7Y652_BRANA|nr:LOW QUALITY PROTEIN: hypothetical protein HID58_080870 [Brassica napus]